MKNYACLEVVKPFMDDLKKEKVLTAEENEELIKEYRNGNADAKAKLVNGNLRLVVKIALSYGNPNNVLDLIQEGTLGLIESIDNYDNSMGTLFTTYAYNWIAKYILKFIGNDRLITLPSNLATSLGKVRTAIDRLTETLNATPSIEDIASETKMTVKEIERILPHLCDLIDLNKTIEDNDGRTTEFLDSIEQDTFEQPESYIEKLYEKQVVAELMKSLDDTEKFVIANYYDDKSLDEIGAELGISRQTVNTIKRRAEQKMRDYAQAHKVQYVA